MRFFVWFSLLVVFWVLFDLCFFEVLLPEARAPLFLLALAVAFIAVLGFRTGFWWVVGSAVLFDILRSGQLTSLVLFVTALAYGTSFLSRRITLDMGGSNRWFFALLLMSAVGVYEIFHPPFSWPRFWDILLMLPVWWVVVVSVQKLHSWLAFTSLSEFRGMRHS